MASAFRDTIHVSSDPNSHVRHRWEIRDGKRVLHRSLYNFATEREAEADAEKFIEKLITWQKQN